MIVEVRRYRVKPGRRDDFLRFFEAKAVPAQWAHGIRILGPLVDVENPNAFVWLRAFPSLAAREEMKNAFYEGELWKGELEAIAMPLLDSYDVVVTEAPPGFVTFEATCDDGAGARAAGEKGRSQPRAAP